MFTAHAHQLGTRYDQVRCLACHTLNGRSPAPAIGAPLTSFVVLTAAASTTSGVTPDPTYGFNAQQQSQTAGAPSYAVSIQSYQTTLHPLPDGTQVELQRPVYAFAGPTPAQFSVRQAPQVIGMGLIEALDEATILALADPTDKNGDGVRGVPNWSIDPETGVNHLGRFGWKAGKGSVRQQAASAFLLDMGVTTPAFRSTSCQRGAADCKTSTATPAVSSFELGQLSSYLELLGVPAQRSLSSGYGNDGNGVPIVVPPEHSNIDAAAIQRGSQLFAQAACTACHVATLTTGSNHPFQELRNQVIHPYTDVLLHDMGPGLADSMIERQATSSMWRTSPLWGLGSLKYVMGINQDGKPSEQNVRYLHDGRARTLMEAIAWHGGEATSSRAKFESLSAADRAAVLAFLGSL